MGSSYTILEMEDLRRYLQGYAINNMVKGYEDIIRVLEELDCRHYKYDKMIKDSPMLLNELTVPFEDLPMYLNHKVPEACAVAEWRLKDGR